MSTRRLAAVVLLDVVGYSRMMAEDEDGTYAALHAHRNEIDPILLNHGGRIVKGTGDGLLSEVPSAVEAVVAAIEAQLLMVDRNSGLPEQRRMELRVGINLGDVIVADDGDIYGDGVNVAARLEGLAPAGGICIAGSVHDQVVGRVDCGFDALGAVEVKNITRPIEAWLVRTDLVRASPSEARPSTYALPRIAVMPFENMSPDRDNDYFVEGITDDLTTALSRYRDLRVASRSSAHAVHELGLDLRATARQLDASHLVQGSVRRVGDQVRVTAQLIEAEADQHIWADRFDRALDDIFRVQDEIVTEIVAAVRPELERDRVAKLERARPEELDSWDLTLRGRHRLNANNPEATAEAIELLERALERDPTAALVHVNLCSAWTTALFNRWQIDDRNAFERLSYHARKAHRLDPNDPIGLAMYAMAENYAGEREIADVAYRRALTLAPHDALVLTSAGQVCLFGGDHERAIEHLTEAWRLAAHEPWRFHVATNLAFAHYLNRSYDAAWAWAQQGLEAGEYLQLHAIGAAALGQLGRVEEAQRQIRHVVDSRPTATTTSFLRNIGWARQQDVVHYRDGLVKAGLPE